MRPEVSSINDRMSRGGDWMAFRNEIASLHASAQSEQERVQLLTAFHNLVAVGPYAYDEETWSNLLPLTRSEYLNFLNAEALEEGVINPVLLDRVTLREVDSGRMTSNDEFRTFAAASAHVIGDSAIIRAHRCGHGTWLFVGSALAAGAAALLTRAGWSSLWLVAVGLVAGTAVNAFEERKIKREVLRRRETPAKS